MYSGCIITLNFVGRFYKRINFKGNCIYDQYTKLCNTVIFLSLRNQVISLRT